MFPTIDELKTYAKNYRYAPVKVEVDLADFDVYQVTDYLDQYYDTCLQLTINNHDQSKFTYIVVDPSAEIRIEADGVYVDGDKQSVNAHEYLNDILTKYRTP